MSETRQATNNLLDMVHDGLLDRDTVILACVNYMSEDEVADMCRANEFVYDDEDEDEHDPECTGCDHDCSWQNSPMGAPYCQICDDHAEAAGDDECGSCGGHIGQSADFPWHFEDEDCRAIKEPIENREV